MKIHRHYRHFYGFYFAIFSVSIALVALPAWGVTLVSPIDGARAGFGSGLSWNLDPAADSYRVCIKFGAIDTCGVQPHKTSDEYVYRVDSPSTSFFPPFNDLLQMDGRPARWKVAACQGSQCNYSSFRSITFNLTPELIYPADNAVMLQGPNTFVWSSVQNASSYRLCLSRPGLACGDSGSLVQDTYGATQYTIQGRGDPFSLGNQIHWTVAACYADQCFYNQRVREITRGAVAGPPSLIMPLDDSFIFSRSEIGFQWSNVPGALTYKLCVSRPGVTCETGDSQIWSGLPGQSAYISILPPLSSAKRLNWTVAACRDLTCSPYQPRVRSLQLGQTNLAFKVVVAVPRGHVYMIGGINRWIDHGDPIAARVCLGTPNQPDRYGSHVSDSQGRVNFYNIPEEFTATISAWGYSMEEKCTPGFTYPPPLCLPTPYPQKSYSNSVFDVDLRPGPNRSVFRVEDGALILTLRVTWKGYSARPLCGPVPGPYLAPR